MHSDVIWICCCSRNALSPVYTACAFLYHLDFCSIYYSLRIAEISTTAVIEFAGTHKLPSLDVADYIFIASDLKSITMFLIV